MTSIVYHTQNGIANTTYEMLRGISEAAQEALAEACSYNEMKTWFLKTFPEIANYHKTFAYQNQW